MKTPSNCSITAHIMTTSSPHHPLLSTSYTKPSSSSKALYIFLFLAAVVGSVALVSIWAVHHTTSSPSTFNARVCNQAHDPRSCMAVLSEVSSTETNGLDLLQMILNLQLRQTRDAIELLTNVTRKVNDGTVQVAVEDCMQLMDLTLDRLTGSIAVLGNLSAQTSSDAHTWLSAVLTNHDTCLEGLLGPARLIAQPILNDLISRARASLAVFVALAPSSMEDDLRPLHGELPSWVNPGDRRRLLESPVNAVKANVVVAKDGSGKYKTVKEAVAAAPDNSNTRYVIYVKRGTYQEKVEIGKLKKNVMLVGDGMDATIITGSLNVADGATTFSSATVAVLGDGFIAQDICFQNTAGPQKHQAVALLLGSDQSVINRCKLDGYQDTLFTYSLRQFYQNSYITGTVDFIFGNAAAVFQNTKLVARKPAHGQQILITAQGRLDPNQNTGISIQKCNVIPSADLTPVTASFKSYLGRPWKQYSRTVFMQSFIGNHIDATGWLPWSGTFALNTLYYGEYMNTGPGAGTSRRVKWKGYHVLTNAAQATQFTVARLIQGDSWLKNTGVSYTAGL